ncbi:MAG: DUF4867 family protein [Lachnospiraceae bacterium]|nr:DUF4867 family protein [Lachnospiraceae bacterium]MDE6979926.1 DUF4867 family protein [Lachnospiraceae bacterium]
MEILKVESEEFHKYGRVIRNVDFRELVEKMKDTPMPEGVVYEPSVLELEKLPVMKELSAVFYGEMPIQIGYCNGHNTYLNGLEYHRSSEVNVAATDTVLILGRQQDVKEDFTYDTSKAQAFFLPGGTGVELYADTLHYAPCGVEGKGFLVAVVLPRGTNGPLREKHTAVAADGSAPNEDALLAAANKWLIGHAEGGHGEGTFLGLKGKNLNIAE